MLQVRLPLPRFLTAGDTFFEKGSLGVLRALDSARVLVVCSGSMMRNEAHKARIEKALGAGYHKIITTSGEPTLDSCKGLAAAMTDFQPDWIVSIGGGSVIDATKIAWLFYEHPDLTVERALISGAIPPLRGRAKFVAVPTTAGTGSEVSSSALFLDTETGRKRYFVTHHFLPDAVILDPALMEGLPRNALLVAGLDALAHAIEGLMSISKHPFMDIQAEAATSLILRHLEPAIDESNIEARSELMKASMMSGWVQNTKIPGIGHAIAHQLGDYGVPHGAGVGLLLGEALKFNLEDKKVFEKMSPISARLGFKTPHDFVEHFLNFPKALGLPTKISGWVEGNKAPNFEKIIEGALNDICARANPRPVDKQSVSHIVESRW